jgi:hypothetical protein
MTDITTVAPATMLPIILLSHPSPVWPGARHLVVHETGRLLTITRGNVLHAAADRLSQEGWSLDSTMVIRDAHALAEDIIGTIADALAGSPAGDTAVA